MLVILMSFLPGRTQFLKKARSIKNSKKRKFKVWNQSGEEYYFNYICEAVEKLNLTRRNLQFVLKGGEYSHGGYFACYVDQLHVWQDPKTSRSIKQKKLKNDPVLVWNNLTNQKFKFDNFNQANLQLRLHRSHFVNVLFGKLNSYKGYKIRFIS